MKKLITVFAGVVFVSAYVVQAQPAPAAAAPAAAQPAVPAPPRPNSAIIPQLSGGFTAQHNANVEIAKKGDIDVLFMGDSITDWWRSAGRAGGPRRGGNTATNAPAVATSVPVQNPEVNAIPYGGKAVFDKYFGSMKVANFGIAGDTTQGVLFRLQHGEGEGFKPKAIMLMIGTNNTGRNSPPEIAIGVAEVVAELRKDFPEAKILLLGVFPRSTPGAAVRGQIAEINKIISCLNDNQHVFYRDIGPIFLAEDGSISTDIMSDGLHPTSKGYTLWAEAVKDTLAGFLQ